MADDEPIVLALAERSRSLAGVDADFDPLLELTEDATCVVIGEATYGTHEFCQLRAELTRRLIVEQGFGAVASVADHSDADRVHRFVLGEGSASDAERALPDARTFPAWRWRNTDVLDFVSWLRDFNDRRSASRKVGFYGLDLYGLHGAIDAVLGFLSDAGAEARARARAHYAGLESVHELDEHATTGLELEPERERELVAHLVELQGRRTRWSAPDGLSAKEPNAFACHEARVASGADAYYLALLRGRR